MKLNKVTTALSGIFAFAATPCFAGPAPMPPAPTPMEMPAGCSGLRGSLGLTFGNTWLDDNGAISGDEEDEFLSTMVELKLGMDFATRYYAQLDVLGETTDVGSADDSYRKGFGSALHLMYRNDFYGVGVFGGWFRTDQDNNRTDTSERILVGLEGIVQPAGWDLHWQAGGLIGNGGNDYDGLDSLRDVYYGRVGASKSLGNGWSVGGELLAAAGVMDVDRDDIRLYGIGAHVEKQFGGMWSLALLYQGNHYDQRDENDRIMEHFVGLNATWHFGGGSGNKDCQPNLSLPPVLRWMGITGGQLE